MKQKLVQIIIYLFLIIVFPKPAMADVLDTWIKGWNGDREFALDLNGDGCKDTVKMPGYDEGDLIINGKKLLSYSKKDDILFGDIQKKDKYIDIIVGRNYYSKFFVYHYNGNNFVKTAEWKALEKDRKLTTFIKQVSNKTNNYVSQFLQTNGDGTITCDYDLGVYKKKSGWTFLTVFLNCRVTPSGLYIDKSRTASVSQKRIKINNKWFLYKKSSLKKNRLIQTISKGSYITPLQIKFSGKYVKLRIKVNKTKKKGWVILKAIKLKVLAG